MPPKNRSGKAEKEDKPEKAKKKDKPEKAVSNRRPEKAKKAKAVTAGDFEPLTCKDFLGCRWEVTENGQIGIWQPADEGERSKLSTLPGKISSVAYDKMCAVVGDEEGSLKRTVLQNIILYSSQYSNDFIKKNQQKIICDLITQIIFC